MFGQTLGIKFKWLIFALDLVLAALLIGRLRPVVDYLLEDAAHIEITSQITYGDLFAALFVALLFSCLVAAWLFRISRDKGETIDPTMGQILEASIYVIGFLEFAATFTSFVQEYGSAFNSQDPSLIDYALHIAISAALVLAHMVLSYLTAVALQDILDRAKADDLETASLVPEIERELDAELEKDGGLDPQEPEPVPDLAPETDVTPQAAEQNGSPDEADTDSPKEKKAWH